MLSFSAETLNAILASAEDYEQRRHGGAGARVSAAGPPVSPPNLQVYVDVVGTIPFGAVLTPTGVSANDPSAYPLAARRKPVVTAAAPTSADDAIVIVSEPAASGSLARAVVAGVAVVSVVVADADHRYARPIAGNMFTLESAESGPAYLLTPPGVGTHTTYVLLGAPPSAATDAPPATSECVGCGWVAGLTGDDCLEVSLLGGLGRCNCDDNSDPDDTISLSSDDGATWTGEGVLTICGTNYTLSFAKETCDGPCLTLTPDGGGSPISYTTTRDCCGSNFANFSLGTPAVCDGETSEAGGPAGNVMRVHVAWSCCPIEGWGGPGWYCVREAGTEDACESQELIDEDKCDDTIEICDGPFETEEDALEGCGPVTYACCGELELPRRIRVTITGFGLPGGPLADGAYIAEYNSDPLNPDKWTYLYDISESGQHAGLEFSCVSIAGTNYWQGYAYSIGPARGFSGPACRTDNAGSGTFDCATFTTSAPLNSFPPGQTLSVEPE